MLLQPQQPLAAAPATDLEPTPIGEIEAGMVCDGIDDDPALLSLLISLDESAKAPPPPAVGGGGPTPAPGPSSNLEPRQPAAAAGGGAAGPAGPAGAGALAPTGAAAVAACMRAHAAVKGRLEDFERAKSEATLWLRVFDSPEDSARTFSEGALAQIWASNFVGQLRRVIAYGQKQCPKVKSFLATIEVSSYLMSSTNSHRRHGIDAVVLQTS
jgi:hypothetical protein